MYTCCPHCAAVFRVSVEQLARAGGRARCGACREAYNVPDALFEDLPAAREAAMAAAKSRQPEPAAADNTGQAAQPAAAVTMPVYQEAAWRARAISGRDVLSVISILLLAMLLGAQWAWFNRATLAVDEGWRLALEEFCAVAGCELPMIADVTQLEIINRDVRQHPLVAEALLINAAFENRAGFTQPYPFFEVSFIDSSGAPVAVRRFRPREYLDQGVNTTQGLLPHTPVQVVLEVMDPGAAAVSFQFDFL